MTNQSLVDQAVANYREVPPDWMPASQVRPFVYEDPALVWLEFYGASQGFTPDDRPFAFLDFIAQKSKQFEFKWVQEAVPDSVQVCLESDHVRRAEYVRRTWELMQAGTPVIVQPALWWAPERIYGAPDLIVRSSRLQKIFPNSPLVEEGKPDHYIVVDLKFTTKLDDSDKAHDLKAYAAQVRLYTCMLGHLQGYMPLKAFLVTRDRLFNPLPVDILSTLDQPLDSDLAAMRDQFIEIKINGARYRPWVDAIVASNLSHEDERWHTAKKMIAHEKFPGRDPELVYQIGRRAKEGLASLGFPSLDSLIGRDGSEIPLERIKGIGPKKSSQIRSVLQANRSKQAVIPGQGLNVPQKEFEFFVDFEYFTNVNVDFETQWPTLDGCEMIFLIGTGWLENGNWKFKSFMANQESQSAEQDLFENWLNFLQAKTHYTLLDGSTSLFHWTGAEVWQSQRAADRHAWPQDHSLRRLPWFDLNKVFLDGPVAIPGALGYDLKQVARALGEYAPDYATLWPEELGEGLSAMVMGWKAYQSSDPFHTPEMTTILKYLESDCKALMHILSWLRLYS